MRTASGHWSRSWTPSVGGWRWPGCRNCQASAKAGARGSAKGAVIRACSGSSGRRLKSPVRIAETVCGWAWNGSPASLRARSSKACPQASAWMRAQRLDLRRALRCRVVLEVRRHDAQRPERRLDDGLEQHPRHAADGRIGRPRQLHAQHLQHRQPAQDHVAEGAARAVRAGDSTGVATTGVKPGSSAASMRELVFALRCPSGREVGRDFLQAEDVEVGEGARVSTIRSGSTTPSQPRHHWMFQVTSFMALPGGRLPQRIPARMNDWTNWRWKSRKPDQQRRRRHQRRGGDDRPVDALVGRREHLQADRQWPRLDRVGDDQRPEEVVPVVAHARRARRPGRRAGRAARRPCRRTWSGARCLRRARRRRVPWARS